VSRFVIHSLLAGLSVIFLTPFAWMLITSLKPNEQAMALPPRWVPRAYHAELGGRRVEVTRDYELRQPGVVAEWMDGGQAGRQVFLPAAQAAAQAGRLRLRHRTEAGWWRVTEKMAPAAAGQRREPAWDIVPASAVSSELRFHWENYPEALERMGDPGAGVAGGAPAASRTPCWQFFANSLIVCVLGVIGTVLSNALAAYGFARLRWRGREAFFLVTVATMMVPFPVLLVPLYGVFAKLGWVGTLLPLWVPAFFGSAFNIFLMRQFFRTIPEELSEAVRIDGGSEWTIFWRVILPLSKPVLATAALLHFLYAWNDFLGPLLYLTRRETYTVALALQSYQSQNGGVQWHYLMAASAVATLPIVVMFFCAQRTFIQGIATTGSKN